MGKSVNKVALFVWIVAGLNALALTIGEPILHYLTVQAAPEFQRSDASVHLTMWLWHFDDIARPLGEDGVRVRTKKELFRALETAWRSTGKFQLIEVVLDRGVTSDTLRRFVATLSQRKAALQC
jgi:thiamine pyrophosphate-dependent acetolactate synthase large subunit-like protein